MMATVAVVVPIISAHGIRNDRDRGTTIRNSVDADGGTFGQVVGFHFMMTDERKRKDNAVFCWTMIRGRGTAGHGL